jgi:signal transduction histidine kinase
MGAEQRGARDANPRVFDALRTERWIAVVRLAVVAVVIVTAFVSGLVEGETRAPMAPILLGLAAAYAAWGLVAFGPKEPSLVVRMLVMLADLAFVTAWVLVTGGASSDYWALYLIVVISAGMRFDLVSTMGVAAGIDVVYGSLVLLDGDLPRELVLHRLSLVIITGFAVGVLAQQRALHRRRGRELQAEVEERGRELSTHRAEVERLRRVDSAKSEFVAVAAHEFRTPLAAIIGVLSALRDHDAALTTQHRLELIDGAAAQARRLARLVDDLLTISRIEDGALRLALVPTDPRHLLSEAAQASGMTGRLVISIGRVGKVRCDPDAAVRVLTNLLDNARKYAPADSKVRVVVELDGEMVRFRVADEGPGIPPEDRQGIFERFRRLEGGNAKPGSGLGLYICRGLVEAHGGTISVGEGPGGGAEFTFTLPRATKQDEIDAEATREPGLEVAPPSANGSSSTEHAERDAAVR